jgi:predicted phage terminase large subunit-like protein
MSNNISDPEVIQELMHDRAARLASARHSHYLFFHLYEARFVKHKTADFQKNLFRITEDQSIKHAAIVAFRGSAKSTIMTLSYPLWAVLGVQQKKFVLLLSQTQNQARSMLMNLKREIETNDLLRADFGALEHQTDEWGRDSLVIKKHGARIMAASTETSIRGLRHGEHRPDLIIADDVEDQNSVKTREGRNKTYSWLMGEVIPAGDEGTRLIVIGNLLHEDSLLMRLKHDIAEENLDGIFCWYPLVDSTGKSLWPGKYPNQASIDRLHKKVPSRVDWEREYMLKIIATQEQVVHPSWIQWYKEIPVDTRHYRYTAIGVDLAISKSDTADFTAMVAAKVYGSGENMRVYILPHPVNERLTFPEQVDRTRLYSEKLDKAWLFIEEVGYQSALIQELKQRGYTAEGVKTHGADKRSRLAIVTHLIQNGQVLFPEHGCEALIQQLVGFGVESHDDLADAFATLMLKVMEKNNFSTGMTIIWSGGSDWLHQDW